jgi:hypothetical protein
MMILLERTSSLGAGDRPILSPLQRPIAPPNVVLVSPGWFPLERCGLRAVEWSAPNDGSAERQVPHSVRGSIVLRVPQFAGTVGHSGPPTASRTACRVAPVSWSYQ